MNTTFPKLTVPRIVGLRFNIVGHAVPPRTKKDSSIPGRFLDKLTKSLLGQDDNTQTGVDNKHFMLETKSKDIHSNTDWTVGTMTLQDIVSTSYVNSSFFEKMQAWWILRYDNDLQTVCNSDIHYFDNDLVQSRIEEGYEEARRKVIFFYKNQLMLNQQEHEESLFDFGDGPKPLSLDNSHQFKGTPGYRMEYTNNGTSLKFRISQTEMNILTSLAKTQNNKNFELQS